MIREADKQVNDMEYDLKRIHTLVIKPLIATLIIAGYYAGLFNGAY